MNLEFRKAHEVYALLAREKSCRQWLLEACEELGFDIKSLKQRSLTDFQKDSGTNTAIQSLRYEHYNTRRNFMIEKVVEFLADRGLLDDLHIKLGDSRHRRQSASPTLLRKTPANDTTFLTNVAEDLLSVDYSLLKQSKVQKVQENLHHLKLEQEKKRFEVLKNWSLRYDKLEANLQQQLKERQEKFSLKDQRRKDLLASQLKKETEREEEQVKQLLLKSNRRESAPVSRAPDSSRQSRHSKLHDDVTHSSFYDKSESSEDIGSRLHHIEAKLKKSEALANEHKKTRSSTASSCASQV